MTAASRAIGRRAAVLVAALLCLCPVRADAQWYFVPFLGTTFAPETTFLVFEEGAGSRLTLGGSVLLLGGGLFGIEGDVAHTPRFFEGDNPRGVVLKSRVTTISGNLVLATPLAVTRESLRPYVVGGLGLMQARISNAAGFLPVTQDLLGLTLGGGAIGLLSPTTGLRFDVRRLKAVTGDDGPFARSGVSRLSFWRASVGVVIGY